MTPLFSAVVAASWLVFASILCWRWPFLTSSLRRWPFAPSSKLAPGRSRSGKVRDPPVSLGGLFTLPVAVA